MLLARQALKTQLLGDQVPLKVQRGARERARSSGISSRRHMHAGSARRRAAAFGVREEVMTDGDGCARWRCLAGITHEACLAALDARRQPARRGRDQLAGASRE